MKSRGIAVEERSKRAPLFMRLSGNLSRAYSRSEDTDLRALSSVGKAISFLEAHFAFSIGRSASMHSLICRNATSIRAPQAATHCSLSAYLLKLRLTRAATIDTMKKT